MNLIIKLSSEGKVPHYSTYVGLFRNEGFGKVIYNPPFLDATANNGLAKIKIINGNSQTPNIKKSIEINTPLYKYLKSCKTKEEADAFIYASVNNFAEKYKDKFRGTQFASQWGQIRSIAMQNSTHDSVILELFDKKVTKERKASVTDSSTSKQVSAAYLEHGVATDKWNKLGRKAILRKFIADINEEALEKGYGDITSKVVINLASAMAKLSKQQ